MAQILQFTPKRTPRFKTWIGDGPCPGDAWRHHPAGQIEHYRTPDDVPVPLRHNIKYAHHTGLTPHHLAKIYDIPVEWVEEFIRA